MSEKIYIIGDNGGIFYGNSDMLDDCYMILIPEEWSDQNIKDVIEIEFPGEKFTVIDDQEIITSEWFKNHSVEEGNQAISYQIALHESKISTQH